MSKVFTGTVTVLAPSSDEKFFDELNNRIAEEQFSVGIADKQFALFKLYEAIGQVRMEFREIEAKHGKSV